MTITISEFEKALYLTIRAKQVVIGSKRVLSELRMGNLSAVVIAGNAPEHIKKLIKYYARVAGVPIIKYPDTSVRLGVVCGKPFVIASLGIRKGARNPIYEMVRKHGEQEIQIVKR